MADMIKRLLVPSVLLVAGLGLASCGSFAGFVSDNWPTWAGGMPKDVPPRPGAPGYDAFVARQLGQDAPAASAPGAPAAPAAAPVAPVAAVPAGNAAAREAAPPVATAAAPPAADRQSAGQGALQGGLY